MDWGCCREWCCGAILTFPFSSSEDTETVSNSSEGRASPHDVLETIFVRKVGAFVNKPINQVNLLSLSPLKSEPLNLGGCVGVSVSVYKVTLHP